MLMGQNPGQNQPATTSMAVIEQGLKVYSAIFKRLHRSLKSEAKKLKRLNRIYLPLESYFQVLDPKVDVDPETGQEVTGTAERIWRLDYENDTTDVQLYSDPNIISELQRTIKAQQIGELMQQGAIPNRDAGTKIILEAMDLPNIDELLTPPPQQTPPDVQLKMDELEMKKAMEADKLDLARDRLKLDMQIADDKADLNETVSLLNIAKAEAAEQGTTIAAYEAELKELKIHSESEKREAREDERVNKLTKGKKVTLNRDDSGDLTGADVDSK
jgi:chaperonin GroES